MSSFESTEGSSQDITLQQIWAEGAPTHGPPMTLGIRARCASDWLIQLTIFSPSDPESQRQPHRVKNGRLRFSQQQQRDPRHLVAPRCLDAAARCIIYGAKSVVRTRRQVEEAIQAGEDDEELQEELCRKYDQYSQRIFYTNHLLKMDQPNSYFLRNLRAAAGAILDDDDGVYLNEPAYDWTSLAEPDTISQLIMLVPYSRFGRWLFRPFLDKEEQIEGNTMLHYHETVLWFGIFAILNCIMGVFTCAPAAIQSLQVRTAPEEVATYLVFTIVFGWLIQPLLKGFEKLLLVCLAYAALMATVMQQNK
ncbi:hypothetical protein NM208_g16158 [Fusarium decemcellulare]|uniref:Uncharacterized protein n=1 Tax=Fusarium decemcellulare TaxID=57161 RepID=A0ACC1RDJ7_9HYPO|nr:hypothetical protein NM208_g16158 [Fusarium decemcellulare]